nr:ubiquitin carboxyl-terminal hydrolase 13-like isoform X1 [Tanacetum cinerariifolium]
MDQAISSVRQYILYYEVLDIPLPELQGLKTLKVALHHATKNEVLIHTIRLPKQSTVGDVITDLKTKRLYMPVLSAEVEADSLELYEEPITETTSIVITCDDSCVRINSISDLDGFTYHKSLPRCGTLMSVDNSGCFELWDSLHETLLQAHSYHKGDVSALVASPSDTRAFFAGCDGQVLDFHF